MKDNNSVERLSEIMTEEERKQRLENVNNQSRIYGAGAIKRHLQSQKREHGKDAHTSIADQPHANSKAAERRRRQLERQAAKGSSNA